MHALCRSNHLFGPRGAAKGWTLPHAPRNVPAAVEKPNRRSLLAALLLAALGAWADEPEAGEVPARLSGRVLETLPVEGVRVREVEPASAVIEWPAKLADGSRFRVEVREVFTGEDEWPAWRWVEWRHAAIERTGDVFVAKLTGLAPARAQAFRVLPLNAAGQPGARIFGVEFVTPPKPNLSAWLTVERGILAALVLALVAILRLRQRGRTPGF